MTMTNKIELVKQLGELEAHQIGKVSKSDISGLLTEFFLADTKRFVSKQSMTVLAIPFAILSGLDLYINGLPSPAVTLLFVSLIVFPFIIAAYMLHCKKRIKDLTAKNAGAPLSVSKDYFCAYSSIGEADKQKASNILAKYPTELKEVSDWFSEPDRPMIFAELAALERYDLQRTTA